MPHQYLDVQCSKCGKRFSLPDDLQERSVRCPNCKELISAPAAVSSRSIAVSPRSESERKLPIQPKRTPSVEQRGGIAGLILGIVALVMALPAMALVWVPILRGVMAAVAVFGLFVGMGGMVTAALQKGRGLAVSSVAAVLNLLVIIGGVTLFLTSLIASTDTDIPSMPEAASNLWGDTIDPDGDCTIAAQGDVLTIQIPPTPHDLSAEIGRINAPRVLREIEGDFRIQVKVSGALQPIDAAVPGRVAFQSGGLLMWSDSDHYVRLERSAMNRNGSVQTQASFEMRAKPQVSFSPPAVLRSNDVYLRLERRGDRFLGATSQDGMQWVHLQPLQASFPAKVRVGVAAVNASRQSLALQFEQLQLNR
jgi:regulation of enolase protein 1 (concanavalin A-like superfamily)